MLEAQDLTQQKIRDAQAESYVDSYHRRGPTFLSIDDQIMVSHLKFKSSDCVLDAGCGVGYASLKIAGKVKDIQGFDFSPESIKVFQRTLAEKNIKNVRVKVGDLTLPFSYGDNSFDKIISNQVLSYIDPEKLPTVFAEFHRVLKQGGTGYFSVFKYGFRGHFRKQKWDMAQGIRRNGYTAEEIQTLLKKTSFPHVKVTGFVNSPAAVRNFADRYSFLRPLVVQTDCALSRFRMSTVTGHWLLARFQK
jgi:SAM-dependent methyltransferase